MKPPLPFLPILPLIFTLPLLFSALPAQALSLHSRDAETLSKASLLVKLAQEEARKRNTFLIQNVRRNHHSTRHGPIPVLPIGKDPTGTGVNDTVAEAAALVTEAKTLGKRSEALEPRQATTWWMEQMVQNGRMPYVANPNTYKVWRNVKDYGAHGDGVHDDTAAINNAVSDGTRCGLSCGSTTTLQAVVYFPPGTYLVSSSIIQMYHTQFIGNPRSRPIIKASSSFVGLGVISTNVYIEGGNGAQWYINQSNFFRQIRTFVIDITAAPKTSYVAGLHWQVAQATSLQNIKFIMSTVAGNNQQGIYMENGSGGFMSDLEFEGGAMGAYVGNQQFTVRNLKFKNHSLIAVQIHWDWGWTWKGLNITNCPVGVHMVKPSSPDLGSALFLDSVMQDVPVAFRISTPNPTAKTLTLSIFSSGFTRVGKIVEIEGGATLLTGAIATKFIDAWGLGKRYDAATAPTGQWQSATNFAKQPAITGPLLTVPSNKRSGFYERSKPQYETIAASQFINVKSVHGAAGNGVADDTAALNAGLAASASTGKILWIPAGVYVVTDTVFVPKGAKVVGQSWSQIMGAGVRFQNAASPRAVVKVGNMGDVGSVEIQDLMLTVRGRTAGAIVLQWNIKASSPGAAAMWDTHIRVGGAAGSNLQVGDCPKQTGSVDPDCIAAALMVHITSQASGYFENNHFWVADHDLDIPAQTQIDIYAARGVLIEGPGPNWLYGTASEHCVLYQYQTVSASNLFMGMLQTESPYFQPVPKAPQPFATNSTLFPHDPRFIDCSPSSRTCALSWAVRLVNSHTIFIYGAGLYSWFSDYTQECVAAENCQDRIFEVVNTVNLWVYSLVTKASVQMLTPVELPAVIAAENHFGFASTVLAWISSLA